MSYLRNIVIDICSIIVPRDTVNYLSTQEDVGLRPVRRKILCNLAYYVYTFIHVYPQNIVNSVK